MAVAFGVAFLVGVTGAAEGFAVAFVVACGVAFGGGATGDAEGFEVFDALGFSGAGVLLSLD